jgi:hypothetical protein
MGRASVLPGVAIDVAAEAAAFPAPQGESRIRPSLVPIGRSARAILYRSAPGCLGDPKFLPPLI